MTVIHQSEVASDGVTSLGPEQSTDVYAPEKHAPCDDVKRGQRDDFHLRIQRQTDVSGTDGNSEPLADSSVEKKGSAFAADGTNESVVDGNEKSLANISKRKDTHQSDSTFMIERLRSIWATTLSEDPSMFIPSDNFFEVGGDSISAQRLRDTAQEQGIQLTIEQIFMNPSLEDMAGAAVISESCLQPLNPENEKKREGRRNMRGGRWLEDNEIGLVASACNVAPADIESLYPLSPMQLSLLTSANTGADPYVRQFVFSLSSSMRLEGFQRAWNSVISSNPVLRTRICRLNSASGYVQAVVKAGQSDTQWRMLNVPLNQFLEWDARVPMTLGHPFFRYTIVVSSLPDGIQQRYFVWTTHHALCDGASIPTILADVSCSVQGIPNPHHESFQSFIETITVNADQSAERNFWMKALGGANPTPYPSVQQSTTFEKIQCNSILKHEILLDTRPLHGVTRALLIRSAWAILLLHYTGSREVCFGAINSGRTSSIHGISGITGPTLNLVPIVLSVEPDQSVPDFLSQVRKQAAAMMPFEHTGITRIRQHLHNQDTTALDFQSLLVVDGASFSEAIEESTKVLGLRYIDEVGKKEQHSYPLVLTFTLSTSRESMLTIQFDERIIPEQQARNLLYHLQTILIQLINSSADKRVGQISPFSENDRMQIRSWNAFSPPPEMVCIHQLFKEQVRRRPQAVAVCSVDESLTYAEVDEYSDLRAVQLAALGVGLGTFVGVCFEKSIWTVVAILAVFKTGAVYVPIDVAHPRGRIEEVVRTVGIHVALVSLIGRETLGDLCKHTITADARPSVSLPKTEVPSNSVPSSLAYLLFTSGSTGKPKGLLMSHTAICSSIIHHGAAFGAGPHWRTLQFGAHTFDLSIGEFFTTLAHGGCICVPSEFDRLNNLDGAIRALNANTLLVVPTVANLLSPKDVPSVRTIVLAGEPITKETVVRWADAVHLTCAYGPSETAVWCSGNLGVTSDTHPGNIGRSIGATMWIVHPDDYHSLSAIGCVGEIVISGALLGNGYFDNKAATDASYVPAPAWFHELSSGRGYNQLYKSGDLARYNPDGTFQIIGRRDTQIKLRGFRIELCEIENQMMATGAVTAAVAAMPTSGPCAGQIVAVVSSTKPDLGDHWGASVRVLDSEQPLVDDLRMQLALVLPEYMVPSVWVVLAKMPLLISGKIDRKFIKTWIDGIDQRLYRQLVELPMSDGDTAEVPPGSLADQIRGLWSDVLNLPLESVTMQSSFIALGGDSIAAIQVASKAKTLNLPLTVRHIISSKTLGQLAAVVQGTALALPQHSIPSGPAQTAGDLIQRFHHILSHRLGEKSLAVVEDVYPLAPFQREILQARKHNPNVFVLSWQMEAFPLSDQPLSLDRLARAWKRVVRHHPILRSIFLEDPSGELPPVQAVLRESAAEPEIVISSATADEAEPAFDSTGTPHVDDCFLPHRAHFVQHGNRHLIHIELDHLVIDGWSLKEVKRTLLAAYDSRESPIAGKAPSYKAFVTAHSPERVRTDNHHWTEALKRQSPSLLPSLADAGGAGEKYQYSTHKTILQISQVEARVLRSFGTKHGLTPASIFDAAWAMTLSRWTGSPDVTFEYVVSGREEEIPGVFEMVGPLINVLAYHVQGVSVADDGPAYLVDLAHRMQEQRSHDQLHTSCNLREVVEEIFEKEKRFNTAVNFQRRPTAVENAMVRVDDDILKSRDPWHFDVLVRVMHITDDDSFRCSLEFDAGMYDSRRMGEIAADFWRRIECLTV